MEGEEGADIAGMIVAKIMADNGKKAEVINGEGSGPSNWKIKRL